MTKTNTSREKKKKWICEECGNSFKLKRDLVEHLRERLEEIGQDESWVVGQLQDLGIENPWA